MATLDGGAEVAEGIDLYHLFAIVVHDGGLCVDFVCCDRWCEFSTDVFTSRRGGGHYMAYVRRRAPDFSTVMQASGVPCGPLTDEWLWFSDEHCGAVSVEEVLSAEPYLLFYEK